MCHHIWTHHLSVGLLDLVNHVVVVFSGLHADQVVESAGIVGWLEGSAVFQRLFPGLVLLYQDQVVPEADEGKLARAVLGSHLFVQRGDGDTVAVVPWLTWCPNSVLRQPCAPLPCLPCRTDVKTSATQMRWKSVCLLVCQEINYPSHHSPSLLLKTGVELYCKQEKTNNITGVYSLLHVSRGRISWLSHPKCLCPQCRKIAVSSRFFKGFHYEGCKSDCL